MRTSAKECKKAGLKNIEELSNFTSVPISTLNDWNKTKPMLFSAIVFWSVAMSTQIKANEKLLKKKLTDKTVDSSDSINDSE